MSQVQDVRAHDLHKRSIFLIGNLPWNRAIQESLDAGLRVIFARLASDHSESVLKGFHRDTESDPDAPVLPYDTEILPDEVSEVSGDLLARLRGSYGEDWCFLPLNDYVTEYVATLSTRLLDPCYPAHSAEVVKRKHELRGLWNRLAAEPDSGLSGVEYCYVEQRVDDLEFNYLPSDGFAAMPEQTPLIVKPDELSSSIEIHHAATKDEALSRAREVCGQLRSKWADVGRSIGTEVRPRVILETEIRRSKELHPGAEFSVEYVSFRGKHHPVGVTQKWLGPNFIEAGHLFPAESFPAHLRPVLERAVGRLLDELGVKYSVSHWEFIITPDNRIALVEGHLRAGGDRIMELVEQSTGRSPMGVLCDALAQGDADFSFAPRHSCGVFWMVPEMPMTEVTEIQEGRGPDGEPGEDLYINGKGIMATADWSEATDWITRFAHIMAAGDGLADVLVRCREVARGVKLSGRGGDGPASTRLKLALD